MKKKKCFFFFSKFSAAHFQLELRNNICSTEGQQDEVKLGVQSQVWTSNLDLPTPHSSFGNDEPVHLAHLPKIEIISAAKLFIRKRACTMYIRTYTDYDTYMYAVRIQPYVRRTSYIAYIIIDQSSRDHDDCCTIADELALRSTCVSSCVPCVCVPCMCMCVRVIRLL